MLKYLVNVGTPFVVFRCSLIPNHFNEETANCEKCFISPELLSAHGDWNVYDADIRP